MSGIMTSSVNKPRPPAKPVAPVPHTSKKPDTVPVPQGPLRVLIADDEHLVATGIAGNVRDLGHTVIGIASDGETAVAIARAQQPDLALLDIRMPKLSGTEVAMILGEELGIPSVIISAFSDDEHIQRIQSYGVASGVYGYLLKPVSADELRVTLGVAMNRFAVSQSQSQRIAQLEQNLVNRRAVEQAKWLLVEKHKMTEAQAHERLQKLARDRRQPLVDVAKAVVESGQLPS